MLDAFIRLLPVAIAGAFVPTWTSRVMILLATRRPVLNGLAFVLGNAAFRLLLGASVLFIARTPIVLQASEQASSSEGMLFVVAALLMLSLAFWLWRKPPKAEEGLPGWMKALESVRPWMSFLYGAALMAMPGVQYVYFMSGVTIIAGLEDVIEQLALLLIFTALLQVMLLAPVALFMWKREHAEKTLAVFREWLAHNGQKATAALVGIFGIVALFVGVRGLGG